MLGDINARPAHVSLREASLRASLFFYGCVFCGFYSRRVHKPMGKFRTGISGTGAYGSVVLVPMPLSRNISSRIYWAQNQKKTLTCCHLPCSVRVVSCYFMVRKN